MIDKRIFGLISSVVRYTAVIVICILGCTFVLLGCTSRSILESAKSIGDQVNNKGAVQVWFVRTEGQELKLVAVERPCVRNDKLKEAVIALLSGPDVEESKQGMNTEIPRGTVLIGITSRGEDLDLNLSRRFSLGDGPDSLETRVEQVRRTVMAVACKKKVYLNVEGKRLEAATGEGLEIKQPLN